MYTRTINFLKVRGPTILKLHLQNFEEFTT